MRVLITGANGHIGRRLIEHLSKESSVCAIVRSDRAAAALAASKAEEVRVLDYSDTEAITRAMSSCTHAVHLVGIIKESRETDFETAHVSTTRAFVKAAETCKLRQIIYLSILGAHENAGNRCHATKAEAEKLLMESTIPSTIFRVPMVLGEGDYASASLSRMARKKLSITFRAASLEQPIYVGDVVRAVRAALKLPESMGICDLAGPTSLSRRDLYRRAGFSGCLISLPLIIGTIAGFFLEKLSGNPPFTREMLGVLDHDDAVDSTLTYENLALTPTELSAMLARVVTK